MDKLVVSTSALAITIASAGGTAPEWVQLLPAEAVTGKSWRGSDGRGPWKVADLTGLLKRSCTTVASDGRSGECDLMVDYDHQSFFPEARGNAVPAAGWIKQLRIQSDGVYGRVEWTPAAAKAITDKEFRFISPQYLYNKNTGDIAQLARAGITNTPNFTALRAVASRETQENEMDELLAALRKALGLKDDADAAACQTAIATIVATAKRGDDLLKAVAAKLKVKPEATQAEFETAIASLAATATATASSDQTIKDLQTQLNALQATIAGGAAEEAVAQAMKDGKIAPASKDWAIGYAKKDPEGFKQFVAGQPKIVGAGAIVEGNPSAVAAAGFGSAEEAAVAKQLGLTAEQMKKKEA